MKSLTKKSFYELCKTKRRDLTNFRAFIKDCPLEFLHLPWIVQLQLGNPNVIIIGATNFPHSFDDALTNLKRYYDDCKQYFPEATYKLVSYRASGDELLVQYHINLQDHPPAYVPVAQYIHGTDDEHQATLDNISNGKCSWVRKTETKQTTEENVEVVCNFSGGTE